MGIVFMIGIAAIFEYTGYQLGVVWCTLMERLIYAEEKQTLSYQFTGILTSECAGSRFQKWRKDVWDEKCSQYHLDRNIVIQSSFTDSSPLHSVTSLCSAFLSCICSCLPTFCNTLSPDSPTLKSVLAW